MPEQTMRAAVAERYGPPEVIEVRDVPMPSPGPSEVLVRIEASTVSSGDVRIRGFTLPRPVFWLPGRLALGVFKPRRTRLGIEFAGVVEALGDDVSRFRVGDDVFGSVPFKKSKGANAEYVAVPSDGTIGAVPEGMTHREAACVPFGLLTARFFLQKKGELRAGQRVLVIGASGSVGCAAVQLAKHVGAHVTAVCGTRNLDLVESLGADRVVDYTADGNTPPDTEGPGYDLVLDAVGASSLNACSKVMAKGGVYLAVVMGAREIAQMLADAVTRKRRIISGVATETPEDYAFYREIVESGGYHSVIDREYPLEEIVEAHRYVQTWRKRGNVVIVPGAAVR